MSVSAESYKKVAYDLRTAKQIERRMILDTLMLLAENGFPIRDYQYTGFGSISFVDFIMVHRLLGLRNMLSVEQDLGIKKRVAFNRPFADVKIAMNKAEEIIPELDRDKRHILWLDYDFRTNKTAVDDSAMAAYVLPPGSILLVTVDVEAPDEGLPAEWKDFYENETGAYFDIGWTAADFAQSELPNTNAQILFRAIRSSLSKRPSVSFIPLFSFLYADGHQMLTVGGMIGTSTDERAVNACDFSHSGFLRRSTSDRPYEIKVPVLTRKERALLDREMPCPDDWQPTEFELSKDAVSWYREIYRYFPLYAELAI